MRQRAITALELTGVVTIVIATSVLTGYGQVSGDAAIALLSAALGYVAGQTRSTFGNGNGHPPAQEGARTSWTQSFESSDGADQ